MQYTHFVSAAVLVTNETGADVAVKSFAGICKNIQRDVVNVDFICEYIGGEIRTGEESLEVKWVSREDAEHTDGNEQNLVAKLRKSKSFIPELSLVAVEDEKVVGHILFTKALVNGTEVLALAPLSVLPKYQNRGIGLSLIKQGHMAAQKLGYKYSVVLGHPEYYPKSGYVPASQYGIRAPFEVEDESFMAVCLSETSYKLNGIMEYDEAFGHKK